ncbi:unnamed protein product [Rotaria socialis]
MATAKVLDSSSCRKVALIISNGNYQKKSNKLSQSISNANDLRDSLKKINFDVKTANNLTKKEMTSQIIDFSELIKNGDLVLFYFCGHGCRLNGKNYLIPVDDATIQTDRDVEDFAVNVERTITRLLERNSSYATIFILDCCIPYTMKNPSASTPIVEAKSLCEIQSRPGALIQFACASSQTVNDVRPTGRNCLFSKHLLRNITRENTHITTVLQDVADHVYRESNRTNKTLCINGLDLKEKIYLNEVIVPVVEKDTSLHTRDFMSQQPLRPEEKIYYEECKEYYHLTGQPLISIPEEVFDNSMELATSSMKICIDEDCNQLNLQAFITEFCGKIKLSPKDMQIKQIQVGSSIIEAVIFNKFESSDKKLSIKMMCKLFTDKLREELAKLKVFFMFMGPIKALFKQQKYRAEINLNPQYNRIYKPGHCFWQGPIKDGIDRGDSPYYCPVGWKRYSFYVTDRFSEKFKGWCICYHGTKFTYGLSILLNGLKPAERNEHGAGIYVSPSIIYTCHPRYAEVKLLDSSSQSKFFKSGKYVQFVLECRVHPNNIRKKARETLDARNTTIDYNIDNGVIEWLINSQNKSIVDFNDPDSSIVCTGLMIRVTNDHPGLLPDSQWWYNSHICNNKNCCLLGIDLDTLQRRFSNGYKCEIIDD